MIRLILKPNWYILFLLLMLACHTSYGQGVLPIQRYKVNRGSLDVISVASTFGYSLRKIKFNYTGFSVKVRRSFDNAEANVSFDSKGIVSTSSNVTVTASGFSLLTVGSVLNFSTFKGTQQLFVTTWYDQGVTANHATQTTRANQPELVLNVAGATNTKPAVLFSGNQYLKIGQPIEKILASGINGSFILWTKPTQNADQEDFGMWKSNTNTALWRWSFHINWSDGECYFDAAEPCCATNRSFTNSGNINLYKQYSFIRGTSYKTVRVNGTATTLNNSPAASTANSGGDFYIGFTLNGTDAPYSGYLSELLMFPTDLSSAQVSPVENNQMNYWSP